MSFLKQVYALPNDLSSDSGTIISKGKSLPISNCSNIKGALSTNEEVFTITGINSDDFVNYINDDLEEQYGILASDVYEWFWWTDMEEWIRAEVDRNKNTFPSYSQKTEDFDMDVESTKGNITYLHVSISYCIDKSTLREIKKYIPENYSGRFKEKIESNSGLTANLKIKDIVEAGVQLPNTLISNEIRYKATKKTVKIVYEVKGQIKFDYKPEIGGKSKRQAPIVQDIVVEIVRTIKKVTN